ncbi:MAG: response regulator [Coleofasciculus sp. S288]|nr:response regulator [Coleofasciculus sp. S288]
MNTTKRILIIDDEVHIREVVQICLETLVSWDVLSAASGREGLIRVQAEQLDAILLDVMMPEMDGLVVLRELRSNPVTQPIPVILLTATAHRLDQQQVSELGVRGVIAKPFNPITLPHQISLALGWDLEPLITCCA